jgi:hypothetical protein
MNAALRNLILLVVFIGGCNQPLQAKPFWQFFMVKTDALCGDYGYGYRIQIPTPPGMPSIPPSVYPMNKACRHLLFGPVSFKAQTDSARSKLIADFVRELAGHEVFELPSDIFWSLPFPECQNAANDPTRQLYPDSLKSR